jgi:hypothetical protein
MAGGGFVYKEGIRHYMKPAADCTATTYYIGSVMVRSADETVQVSATITDTALSVLVGGRQPFGDDDYCTTSDKLLEVATEGVVWVRSSTAMSWTFMAPAYLSTDDGMVNTSNGSSATKVGYYVCDKDKNVADRTTTASGELVGIQLALYGEAT